MRSVEAGCYSRPVKIPSAIRPIILYPLILTVLACGREAVEPSDPADRTIAIVSGRSIVQGSFEVYVIDALGGVEEAAGIDAEVRSRLLDQFLDEELLVGAALDEGLSVSEDEIGRFLPAAAGNQERVRRVLLQKKYKEQVITNGSSHYCDMVVISENY